jgi:hypothetical protein
MMPYQSIVIASPGALSGVLSKNARALCAAVIALSLQSGVCGQSTPPSVNGGGTSSELVEGLLDLLAEPDLTRKPGGANLPPKVELTPADVGLAGEDLGEASANPLMSVRQSMLIAAGYLQKGVTNAETQQLQFNIVQRLDDIIHELENSPPPNRSPREQSQSQPANQQQQAGLQQPQSSQSAKRPGDDPSGEPGQPNGDPIDRSTVRSGGGVVELADPKSLQQSVWGQLPERVRQQMQSRMVEQFLPAYREQIEAYFQALLK